jgi:hypothetical protein
VASGMPAFYDLGYGEGTFVAGGDRKIYQTDPLLPRFGPVVRLTTLGLEGEILGEVGGKSRLLISTNLTDWTDIQEITNTSTRTPFLDPGATNPLPARYYRLRGGL